MNQWRRVTAVMVGASFVASAGFSFVTPFLPLYFVELGVRDMATLALWSGVAIGAAPFCSAATAPAWGLVADRHGVKRVLGVGMAAYTLILLSQTFVDAPWQVVAGRAVMGFFGGFSAMALSIVAIAAPRERVTMAVGLVQASQILGQAIGPLFGGFAAESYGVRGSFIVAAALTGLSALALIYLLPTVRVTSSEQRTARQPTGVRALRATLSVPGFLPILGVILVARGVERTFDPILPLYVARLQDTGVATTTGLIAAAGTLATAAACVVVGRLTRRWSAHRLLSLALLGGALSCLPIPFVTSSHQLLALRVVWGLLAGGAMTLAFATGGTLLPPERRGSAFGLLGSAAYYGASSGAFLSGVVATLSLPAVFVVDAALYVAGFLWLVAARRGRAAGPYSWIPGFRVRR